MENIFGPSSQPGTAKSSKNSAANPMGQPDKCCRTTIDLFFHRPRASPKKSAARSAPDQNEECPSQYSLRWSAAFSCEARETVICESKIRKRRNQRRSQ